MEQHMLLRDKVAIVTGSSRGIGAVTAKLLASHGAKVAYAAVTYIAMQDCLSMRAWWSIQAQADIDDDYAQGVDAIEEEYNKYLDSLDR